jgi:serine/threonine-protein kinase
MVFISAGEFKMGSEVGFGDEQPAHLVFLDAFWIDQTEVTNAMYKLCVQSGACDQPSVADDYDDPAYATHPVVSVSWVDAKAYCVWAGRRLPTEAEWEKAASWDPVKNDKRVYPWGNEFDCSKGNFDGSSCDAYEGTSPAGAFPSGASPYSALDMGGNVWEWVNDAFLETDPFGLRENYYAVSPYANPQGVDPSTSTYRVIRGGAWKLNFGGGRTTYRLWLGLDDFTDYAGFRCARSE